MCRTTVRIVWWPAVVHCINDRESRPKDTGLLEVVGKRLQLPGTALNAAQEEGHTGTLLPTSFPNGGGRSPFITPAMCMVSPPNWEAMKPFPKSGSGALGSGVGAQTRDPSAARFSHASGMCTLRAVLASAHERAACTPMPRAAHATIERPKSTVRTAQIRGLGKQIPR